MENFPQVAKDFFSDNKPLESNDDSGIFLVRPDGVPVYHYSSFGHNINEASIGALLSGVWQAAKALSSFLPENKSQDEFRLSFDTSSKGVYILPVNVGEQEYYLGIIYHNEINPGLVKSHLRSFVSRFNNYLEQKALNGKGIENKVVRESALFNNITDDEMDKLFSF